jgi:endonuclease/exonuclease/phosphatase family metal-dependent hydrolase
VCELAVKKKISTFFSFLFNKIFPRATKTSSPSKKITLCALNTENLFISLEHHNGEDFNVLSESQWRRLALPQLRRKQKPLSKVWGLTTAIQDINPDILMLVEVGGRESLDHFNHSFLKDTYTAYFVETNSNRSIDLAFLVKKDLKWTITTLSHRETPIHVGLSRNSPTKARFSRDVAELRLHRGRQLELILLLTHFKSKLSTDTDYQGRDLRQAEATALAELYQKISAQHPDVPIVVGGDLNSDLSSPELEALRKTNLLDFHDVIETPAEDRISFVHFDYTGQAHPQVLDYLLISPHLSTKVLKEKSQTYRYKSYYDTPHPLPRTVHQRYHMPSDHYPVVLTLDLQR